MSDTLLLPSPVSNEDLGLTPTQQPERKSSAKADISEKRLCWHMHTLLFEKWASNTPVLGDASTVAMVILRHLLIDTFLLAGTSSAFVQSECAAVCIYLSIALVCSLEEHINLSCATISTSPQKDFFKVPLFYILLPPPPFFFTDFHHSGHLSPLI